MRILIVTEALVAGGAETFALRLVRKLRQLGHHCDLLNLNPDLENAAIVNQYSDVPIIRPSLPALRWLKRMDRALKIAKVDWSVQRAVTLGWLSRNGVDSYDVCHTNLFGADWLFAGLKARFPKMRLLSTLHGDYALFEGAVVGTERRAILNWRSKVATVIAAVDHWVCISADQRRMFEHSFGLPANRMTQIYNGYEPPAAVDPMQRSGPFTFVMVARGMKEKGWSFLIEAFQRLTGDVHLKLVGQGAYLEELKSQCQGDLRIEFVGFHANPVEVIQGADVFVLPSVYVAESLPTVIVEALYCGKPVIATDIGEIAAMLLTPNGETAGKLLTVHYGAVSIEKLAAAMQTYADNPKTTARDGKQAEEAFTKFDMGKCAERYVKLYSAEPQEGITCECALGDGLSIHQASSEHRPGLANPLDQPE